MMKMMFVFWKLLLNRSESENEFYIPKFGLIHSFPTLYHMQHSDKWFENFFRKNIENLFDGFLVFWILFKNRIDLGKNDQHEFFAPFQ